MSLNYTPLRHRMLAEVAKDRDFTWVPYATPVNGSFDHMGGALGSEEKRALRQLMTAGLLGSERPVGRDEDAVFLTAPGQSTLGLWSAQHGDPQ